MANISFGDEPKPEEKSQKAQPTGFRNHFIVVAIALFLMAAMPSEAFIVSLLLGLLVIGAMYDLVRQYKIAFGDSAEKLSISAGGSYRTNLGAPSPPAKNLKAYSDELFQTNQQMMEDLRRIGGLDILEREAYRSELQATIGSLESQVATRESELKRVEDEVLDVRQTAERHNVGYYDYEHPAEHSVRLADDLALVRSRIKELIRDKKAVTTVSGFTFNGSAKEGSKFVRDLSALLLRAYNAEAENCVKTVKAGNLSTASARLEKAREQIAKRGTMIGLQVTDVFHRYRERELELAAEHLQAVAMQKQLEAEARAEAREAAKAQKEWEALKAKQQKEVDHFTSVLQQLQEAGDVEGVQRVQDQLDEAEAKLADAEDNALNTRAGYVYVISNLGAFGEGVVKIGMTRRLNPMERVRELGDASVPFLFDVHALFFSKDAVGIETVLHRHFAKKRVNLINLRREYFYATPSEVRDALIEHHVEIVEYQEDASAEEFSLSKEMRLSDQFQLTGMTG